MIQETLPEETLPEEEPTEESTTEEDCTELVACDSVETASKKASAKSGVILLLVLLAVITALAFWCSSLWLATLIVSAATALGSLISIQYAKKNLGGIQADIIQGESGSQSKPYGHGALAEGAWTPRIQAKQPVANASCR